MRLFWQTLFTVYESACPMDWDPANISYQWAIYDAGIVSGFLPMQYVVNDHTVAN